MNGYQYILAKQTEWAKNRGLFLIGSKIERGRLAYTKVLDDNLFQPLLPDVEQAFRKADGDELGDSKMPGKMQAIHSSSALCVNVFQYWKSISAVPLIATACGLCRQGSSFSADINFEEKCPVNDSFGFHPNIDAVIQITSPNRIKAFAIESKFSEAYGAHKHGGLKAKYLASADLWSDIPRLRAFAQRISPDDKEFQHLHPAQLIKHILAMKRQFGKDGFRLLYLWYDVIGEQGKRHHDEVGQFAKVAEEDGIKFHSLTYQELISKLAVEFRSSHGEYVRYLTERYL